MRVIGGIARGRNLRSPKNLRIRPTSDRVKEALFNIITKVINGAHFLDLFAGAGSIGIEALSRGAASAVFIDQDWNSIKLIRANLELTGFTAQAKVYRQEAIQALLFLQRGDNLFDLVFLDPPYRYEKTIEIIEQISKGKILIPGGMVIVEHSRSEVLRPDAKNLQLWQQRFYGDTALSFYIDIVKKR